MEARSKEDFSPVIWMTAASMLEMLDSGLENVVWARL